MCGIVGYTGAKNAEKILLKGLSRLEYRGYDSAGISIIDSSRIKTVKRQGKLSVLTEELKKCSSIRGTTGIGHTRWATHGVPSDNNAHPHRDSSGDIAIVHNGIIENYHGLKKNLIKKGYKFRSETDTEVIAHLISRNYNGDLLSALKKTIKELKGSFALAVIHKKENNRIVAARKDSPLVIGRGDGESFLASDIPAILEYTKNIIYMENNEMADISPEGVKLFTLDGEIIKRKAVKINWDVSRAEKAGYKHFMLKEIFEQADIMSKILSERIKNNSVEFKEFNISPAKLKKTEKIVIVACGTAFHAGLIGKYIMEKMARLPVWVDQASEFRYRDPIVDDKTLVIVISQSGETADTLAALREAKARGATVAAICNVLGSSIAREADGVIYTHAGPEIAVASTKAYTAQITILYLLSCYLTIIVRGKAPSVIPAESEGREPGSKKSIDKNFLKDLKKIPAKLEELLKNYHSKNNKIARYAEHFHEYYLARNNKSCFLYLARNINYPNALEGALKLKEISYISAEGYPAGEMKHGPIALIDENPWVVAIAVKSGTYDKMISNIQEIKARGGIIIAIVSEGDELARDKSVTYAIEIPVVDEIFSPILVAVPLQLLAYYVAMDFGYDIDKPRNLAKSVTVE